MIDTPYVDKRGEVDVKCYCFLQNTGILFHGVDVLLSSSVNKTIHSKKHANAEAKCHISWVSKIPILHSVLRCRDSDGLISVLYSLNI